MQNPADGSNEPDFMDSLDVLLQQAAGVDMVATLPEFARWRWFTGARDDSKHFSFGDKLPDTASVFVAANLTTNESSVDPKPAPMLLGSVYVRISGLPGEAFTLTAELDQAVAWAGHASRRGPAQPTRWKPVGLAAQCGRRAVRGLLGPTDRCYDPDERDDTRYSLTLTLTP